MKPALNDQHKDFLITQVATFAETRNRRLAVRLASSRFGEQYNFRPVKITFQGVHQFLSKPETKARIAEVRRQWSADVYAIELGNKAARINELVKLYHSIDDMKRLDGRELSPLRKLELKQQILRHIKEEVGEDVEKLADALRTGGAGIHVGDIINNVWRTLTPEERDEAKRDVADCLAPGSGRNRLSDITG